MLKTTQICSSILYNSISSSLGSNESKSLNDKSAQLKIISDSLKSYGGVLAKISQMLSLDNHNNDVFANHISPKQSETIEYFKSYIKSLNNDFLGNVNYNVTKSGTIGQIHKASINNKDVIFKVQYVGIMDDINNDLQILNFIVNYLYNFANLGNSIKEVKEKILDEVDYDLELSNQNSVYDIFGKTSDIIIPITLEEFSNDKVLCMEYIHSIGLIDFISNGTKQHKNRIGRLMIEFIFSLLYKENMFYSDMHYGNFLVNFDSDNSEPKLVVVDFGCIHYINQLLVNELKSLHKSIRNNNKELFYKITSKLNIINDTISKESKSYIYDYFRIQYEPFYTKDFKFSREWLDKCSHKNTELMKEWMLPDNMIYFHKIPYGLYHILTKLELDCDFVDFFDKILND